MSTTLQTTPDEAEIEAAVGAFAERVVMATIGTFELATIELGMRLGLYEALSDRPTTAPDLAARAGIDARYAREWLEQQATSGFLAIDDDADDADARVFSLPVAHAACLLDPDSLACVAPLATFAVAGPAILPELVEAYRAGTGISFGGYGEWIRRAQAAANRPQFTNLLAAEWFPAMPDVVARLEGGPTLVADVGCGCGWSSIALARAYPQARVHGFDTDVASIDEARANAEAAGVADRIDFHAAPLDDSDGVYDLVCCFEALHDMARPVQALASMRRATADDGVVFIVDERAADALTASDPDPAQRLFYSASVMHCLPVGRSEEDSVATGTVLRAATLERYASDAGFESVEILPVNHDMFRFYRLHI